MTISIDINSSSINNLERKFKEYCDKNDILATFFHQSISSFPKVLRENGGKRPDFLISTKYGDILVDVKSGRLDKYCKFVVGLSDFNKLEITERILKKIVYLAFPTDPWGKGNEWGFIPLARVRNIKEEQQNWIDQGYRFIGIEYEELKRFDQLL